MMLRLFVDPQDAPLAAGATLALPEAAVRHAQSRRVQPGDALALFDGHGHEAEAEVLAVGRRAVSVRVGKVAAIDRELPLAVTLALGMPANERMDALVEKATELGVAALQPLQCERSVLRLAGERAEKRRAHWQAVAASAAEQSGRTCVPVVAPVATLREWLVAPRAAGVTGAAAAASPRWVLSLEPDARSPHEALADLHAGGLVVLSGPEGGLASAEAAAARAAGFVPVSLGPRVLRADTAPLALLAWLGLAVNRLEAG